MMVQYQELLMSMFSNADSRRDEAWVARLASFISVVSY